MPTEELTSQSLATDLTVRELPQFTPEAIQFIESVRWGTQGVLYTLNNYESTLSKILSPLLFMLYKHEKLIAMRMALQKSSSYGNKPIQTLYHGFTAVCGEEQGHGYGKMIARYGLSRQRELLGPRGLMYCYIEDGNDRSMNLIHGLGYARIGQFHATVFSRLFPKDWVNVYRLHPDHERSMRRMLSNLYADHALMDFEMSLRWQDYWVWMENGEVLAGAQVDPQRWEIQSIPGVGGFLAQKILPRLPVIRQLFNPDDFRFLKFSNVYFQTGHADAAVRLFEALLSRFHAKAAMLYLDKRSPIYLQLEASGGFGLLNQLAETPVNVLGLFQGFQGHEISDFCRYPLVLSPLDAG